MTQHSEPGRMPHRGDAPMPTATAVEASDHLGQDDADTLRRSGQDDAGKDDAGKDGAGKGMGGTPPRAPGGLSSGLQPGGTTPGKSPGASVGSIGTGGGSTGNSASGAVKKGT